MNKKKIVASVKNYVEIMRTETLEKNNRDVQVLEEFKFWKRRRAIAPAELNKCLAEFIRSGRRKHGEDYKPSSLRCLVSSVKSHLKKNLNCRGKATGQNEKSWKKQAQLNHRKKMEENRNQLTIEL